MSRFSEFLDSVRERGARFLDKLGRGRRAAEHVRTVLQDAVVDAYNGAQLIRAAASGSPGVEVSDGLSADSDEPCLEADGQLWGLGYALANKKEHPGCVREFSVMQTGDERKLDRE